MSLLVLFFLVGVVWRSWLQRRRTGQTGWFLFRGDVGTSFFSVLGCATLAGDAALAAFAPDARALLHPLDTSMLPGAVMFLAALLCMVWAQLDLGASWRIGIDPTTRPGLVTDGIYRWSRNPIYACALAALVGFALLLPDLVTFACLVLALVGVHLQVRTEERYLAATYGDDFMRYCARVPRYLPI